MNKTFKALAACLKTRRPILVSPQHGVLDLLNRQKEVTEILLFLFLWFIIFKLQHLHFAHIFICCAIEQTSQIKLVLPGSFNPLHDGHISVLQQAALFSNLPVSSIQDGTSVFELCTRNVDKTAIGEQELYERVRVFAEHGASLIVTTGQPTFVDKATVYTLFV